MKIAYKKLSAWLLGLLGVAGCDGNGIFPGNAVCMYGTPNADFKINATVTDENGKALEGIKVSGLEQYASDPGKYFAEDSVKTTAAGKAELSFNTFPQQERIAVAFTDVDGASNGGTFQTDTIKSLEFKQTKKGGDWYSGTYEASVSVKLKKQQ